MEFLPALSAWQWALLAAVPPAIVALYFLKLRRQPLEVPSTYLWQKSIEDLHVNSLWQRIRQNLLLYLQLLLVLLVILALLRPGWHSQQLVDQRNILLIDNSASMSATDVAPSRLADAKRRALTLIDDMQTADERDDSGQYGSGKTSPMLATGSYQAMVVSFSDTARVEQGWTGNLRELREAVARIQPTNRPTDISEALRVTSGLAAPPRNAGQTENQNIAPPAKLFIFSDGRFPAVKDVSLANLAPVLVPIGRADSANLGIVAFSVRRNESRTDQQQAFGSIANFGPEAVTAPIDLLLNGKLIDAAQFTIKPGETSGVSFNLGDTTTGILELRISRDDALAVDNRAWAAINGSHRPKVLIVTPGNPSLELAVSTSRAGELADVSKAPPSILQTKQHQAAAAAGEYDLIIYDRCQPKEMPHANTLFIGEAPPPPSEEGEQIAARSRFGQSARFRLVATGSDSHDGSSKDRDASKNESANGHPGKPTEKWWSLGDPVEAPQIIDVDRTHPLTEWLDLGDVDFAQARPVMPPPGGTRLIDSNKGTLFAIASREGFEDAVLGCEIYSTGAGGASEPNTNWPIRRSFPEFVYAVLSYLGGGGVQASESLKSGQPMTIRSEAAAQSRTDQLTIVLPDLQKRTASRGKNGLFSFNQTDELGAYEVLQGGKPIQWFTVNLADELESNIPPVAENSLKIGNTPVPSASQLQPVRRETWRWLLGAALAVLLLEWYIYNRRIYV